MDNNLLVDELLSEINKNPYKYLKEKGYKGKRGNILSCPVANCCGEELGTTVFVGPASLSFINGDVVTKTFKLPKNIQKFISDFDEGEYQDLNLRNHHV